MDSFGKQCDALAPPLVSPLRAVLYMLAIVYLPHVLRIPMVFKAKGFYDNMHARHQVEKLNDKDPMVKMVKRATSAHANSWEAFAYFSVSCIVAHICNLDVHIASSLCTLFLILRVAYVFLYIFGIHPLIGVGRSLVWLAAILVSVRLNLLALEAAGL